MLALLTNGGASHTPTWNVAGAGFGANEALVDVLSCTGYTTDARGAVSITGSGGEPQVRLADLAMRFQ